MKKWAICIALLLTGCYQEDGAFKVDSFLAFRKPDIISGQYGIKVYYDAEPEFGLSADDYDFVFQETQSCVSIFNDFSEPIIITNDLDKFCSGGGDADRGRYCYGKHLLLIKSDDKYPKYTLSHEYIHYLLEESGRGEESRKHEPEEFFMNCPEIFSS
jgi:hypothetical protein